MGDLTFRCGARISEFWDGRETPLGSRVNGGSGKAPLL
jgi:hypothetical protein